MICIQQRCNKLINGDMYDHNIELYLKQIMFIKDFWNKKCLHKNK